MDQCLLVSNFFGRHPLANELYKDGFTNITNIDISEVCVRKMSAKYPFMNFYTMDMANLEFDDGSFDIVIEKATLDSLLVDCESQWNLADPSYKLVLKSLNEVKRVLKFNGLFISYTFSQPHFRVPLLATPGLNWSISVDKFSGDSCILDYYMVTCHHGQPDDALKQWSVGQGPVIVHNDSWSSSDEEEFINKFDLCCFNSEIETDEDVSNCSNGS